MQSIPYRDTKKMNECLFSTVLPSEVSCFPWCPLFTSALTCSKRVAKKFTKFTRLEADTQTIGRNQELTRICWAVIVDCWILSPGMWGIVLMSVWGITVFFVLGICPGLTAHIHCLVTLTANIISESFLFCCEAFQYSLFFCDRTDSLNIIESGFKH